MNDNTVSTRVPESDRPWVCPYVLPCARNRDAWDLRYASDLYLCIQLSARHGRGAGKQFESPSSVENAQALDCARLLRLDTGTRQPVFRTAVARTGRAPGFQSSRCDRGAHWYAFFDHHGHCPCQGGMDQHGHRRSACALSDPYGRLLWFHVDPLESAFYEWARANQDRYFSFFGAVYRYSGNGVWYMYNPEPILRLWGGRPRPVYGSLHHSTQRSLRREQAEPMQQSYMSWRKSQNIYLASFLNEANYKTYLKASQALILTDGLKDQTARYVASGYRYKKPARDWLLEMLDMVNRPKTMAEFDAGKERVARVAATCVAQPRVKEAIKQTRKRQREMAKIAAPKPDDAYARYAERKLDQWAYHMPFDMTPEQRQAAHDMIEDMMKGHPMKRVLSGDAGSGKTAVFTIPAAAMIEQGCRVAVISPSSTLALQTHHALTQFIPGGPTTLIAGEVNQVNHEALL